MEEHSEISEGFWLQILSGDLLHKVLCAQKQHAGTTKNADYQVPSTHNFLWE